MVTPIQQGRLARRCPPRQVLLLLLLTVLLHTLLLVRDCHSFSPLPTTTTTTRSSSLSTTTTTATTTQLYEQPDEWKGFNPFDQSSGKGSDGLITTSATAQYRQNRMEGIMSELLECVNANTGKIGGLDEDEMNTLLTDILDQHRDFLLEPLDDEEAVLDRDSIYSDPSLDRAGRYGVYRETMAERVKNARYAQTRRILQCMMDYVLSFE